MAPKILKEQKLIGEDGKQPINTARFTATGAFAELNRCDKLGRPRVWAANYEPLLVPDSGGGQCCVLRCRHCASLISPSNPAGNAKAHSASCTKHAAAKDSRNSPRHLAAKASRTLSDDEMDDLSPSRRQKKFCKVLAFGLESFTVKGPQQAQFDKNFALYMITSETPFLRANNPYLRKAISILGGRVPDESVIRKRLLIELYNETVARVAEEMDELLDKSKVSLASGAFDNAMFACAVWLCCCFLAAHLF